MGMGNDEILFADGIESAEKGPRLVKTEHEVLHLLLAEGAYLRLVVLGIHQHYLVGTENTTPVLTP